MLSLTIPQANYCPVWDTTLQKEKIINLDKSKKKRVLVEVEGA